MAETPDWLTKISDPAEWRERIDDAEGHKKRRDWLDQVKVAKDFVSNKFDPGVQTVDNIYWYKSGSYIRIRNYVLGRLGFGEMKPKVLGVELPDENLAWMYEKAIDWEFTRPRGGNRTVGRREITPCLMKWVDFGLGDINTRFDPYRVDRENYTGSIITEEVDSTSLILDPDVDTLRQIRFLARKFDVSESEFGGILPAYRGDLPLDERGRTILYENQFRVDRPIEVKFNSSEASEYIIDNRPYWKSEDEFKNAFLRGMKERKSADPNFKIPYHPNVEAQKLWDSFKSDYIALPLTYSMLFVGTKDNVTKLVHGPYFVGDDFTHTLIPFVEIYGTPYPVGAPFYVSDMQKLEILFKTLYVRQLLKANNSNIVVDLSKIDSPKQAETLKQFRSEIGAILPLKNIQRIEQAFHQVEIKPPHQVILEMAKYIRWEIDEFFNTHEAMTGMPPFAGASGELTKVLQAAGTYPLGILINSIQGLMDNVFRKIAKLVYRYMPYEKRIMVSDAPDQMEMVVLEREIMTKADPNDFDISVKLDTTGEQEKLRREQNAITAFQLGLYDPETTLEEMGKKREAPMILARNQRYMMGQRIVQIMEEDKDLAAQLNAALKAKALEMEEKKNA